MNWKLLLDTLALKNHDTSLEKEILPIYLRQARWFGGKSRQILSVTVQDNLAPPQSDLWLILLLKVVYASGQAETYLLPITSLQGKEAAEFKKNFPAAIIYEGITQVESELAENQFILCEAIYLKRCREELLQLFMQGQTWQSENGSLKSMCSPNYLESFLDQSKRFFSEGKNSLVLNAEQSNTSILFGDCFFLKIIRRLEAGENPDIEMLRFLNERTDFKNAPKYYGCLEYYSHQSKTGFSIAVLQNLVKHKQGGWDYALELAKSSFATHFQKNHPAESYATLIGKRTAEMHLALGSSSQVEAFAPEVYTESDLQFFRQNLRTHLETVLLSLKQSLSHLDDSARELAVEVITKQANLKSLIEDEQVQATTTSKIRIHGDYHLGQILWTGEDIVILDFEGEPTRSLEERRKKNSALKDVAGMIRSFHYAIYAVALENQAFVLDDQKLLIPTMEQWFKEMKSQFLESYQVKMQANGLSQVQLVGGFGFLNLFIIEKALYELEYELNNRPTWTAIPLLGILSLLRS